MSPSLADTAPTLAVSGLTKIFGGVRAASDRSFEVAAIASGKSTVSNLIADLRRPGAGAGHFGGGRLHGLKTYGIARLGIGRTFQAVKIFRDLSVWDNLSIAAMGRQRSGWEPAATSWLE